MEYWPGTRPIQAANCRPFLNSRALPTLATRDQRLVRRAAAGDERAFAAIYRRYHQDLYRYCLALLRDREDAAAWRVDTDGETKVEARLLP